MDINNNVAEKAECSCKGRNWRIARLNQPPEAAVLETEDSATMSRFYTEQPCEPDTADGSNVTKVLMKKVLLYVNSSREAAECESPARECREAII